MPDTYVWHDRTFRPERVEARNRLSDNAPYRVLVCATECCRCHQPIEAGVVLPEDVEDAWAWLRGLQHPPKGSERTRKYCTDCRPLVLRENAAAAREKRAAARIGRPTPPRKRVRQTAPSPEHQRRGRAIMSDADVIDARCLYVEWAHSLWDTSSCMTLLAQEYGVSWYTMMRILYCAKNARPFWAPHYLHERQRDALTQAAARRIRLLGAGHKKLLKLPVPLYNLIRWEEAFSLASLPPGEC